MTQIIDEHAGLSGAAADPDPLASELLQSIVEVARAIFGAAASSLLLLDDTTQELVFEAVSGQGQGFLVGRRFPAGAGIAGWVAASGEPMVVDDVSLDRSFDRAFAESTQYVPDSLMAAPLVNGERTLGVLEVLDAAPQSRSNLGELDLLALFARQSAAALRVVVDRRGTSDSARGSQERSIASPADRRATALQLLSTLEQVLRAGIDV